MNNVSRNDPCPCGSSKKYKKCCLPTEQQNYTETRQKYKLEMIEDWNLGLQLVKEYDELQALRNKKRDCVESGS